MPADLGFIQHGEGPIRVIVLHDWFCDHNNWDATLPWLTPNQFTYVFADLRGYDGSRHLIGTYSLEEVATDVIALADRLGWKTFSLVGHSMTGLVVQRIAQLIEDRILRVVAITPVPPTGINLGQTTIDTFQNLALADDATRLSALTAMWGDRLSPTWTSFKLRRWRETAEPAAAAGYVEMWGCERIAEQSIKTPILIVTAGHDAPPFQVAAWQASMPPFYPNASLITFSDCGHYPMQEQPPLLATAIERFLSLLA